MKKWFLLLLVVLGLAGVAVTLQNASAPSPDSIGSAPPADVVPGPARPACPFDGEGFCRSWVDQLRSVRQAALEYQPPPTMVHHRAVTVAATIDSSVIRSLNETLPTAPGSVPVRVTPRMAMRLDGDNFTIAPDELVDQDLLFAPIASKTTWTWRVTPTRRGTQTLRLHTYIAIDGAEKPSFTEVTPAQVSNVSVKVNPVPDIVHGIGWLWKTLAALAGSIVTLAAALKLLRRTRTRPATDASWDDACSMAPAPAELDVTETQVLPDGEDQPIKTRT